MIAAFAVLLGLTFGSGVALGYLAGVREAEQALALLAARTRAFLAPEPKEPVLDFRARRQLAARAVLAEAPGTQK